jgi:uncharacterized protein (DUF488 family)
VSLPLFTIGHGTRSIDDFVSLLREHRIVTVADVRSYPSSRANPQFNRDALAASLEEVGVRYDHRRELGGRRHGLGSASPNTAWTHPAFRGYADYMLQDVFWNALDDLLAEAAVQVTTVMCSETLWWRCHRRMIADAAIARGVAVMHVMKPGSVAQHELTPFAKIVERRVRYDG